MAVYGRSASDVRMTRPNLELICPPSSGRPSSGLVNSGSPKRPSGLAVFRSHRAAVRPAAGLRRSRVRHRAVAQPGDHYGRSKKRLLLPICQGSARRSGARRPGGGAGQASGASMEISAETAWSSARRGAHPIWGFGPGSRRKAADSIRGSSLVARRLNPHRTVAGELTIGSPLFGVGRLILKHQSDLMTMQQ